MLIYRTPTKYPLDLSLRSLHPHIFQVRVIPYVVLSPCSTVQPNLLHAFCKSLRSRASAFCASFHISDNGIHRSKSILNIKSFLSLSIMRGHGIGILITHANSAADFLSATSLIFR
jgi:hypothetical protein